MRQIHPEKAPDYLPRWMSTNNLSLSNIQSMRNMTSSHPWNLIELTISLMWVALEWSPRSIEVLVLLRTQQPVLPIVWIRSRASLWSIQRENTTIKTRCTQQRWRCIVQSDTRTSSTVWGCEPKSNTTRGHYIHSVHSRNAINAQVCVFIE